MTRSRYVLSFGENLELDLVLGEQAPAAAQALVIAQDVHLILGEVGVVEDTRESPQEVLETSSGERPRRRGSIVAGPPRGGVPLLQAIVYDFQESPPAREVHVFEALVTAFELARSRSLSCLALQPLGTAHAGVAPGAFLRLLTQVCYSSAELGTTLRRVHLLLASPHELARYETQLQALAEASSRWA
jgi:hypothetical protein